MFLAIGPADRPIATIVIALCVVGTIAFVIYESRKDHKNQQR
jgi:cbb3-type cytochrome oxidase subunit 3